MGVEAPAHLPRSIIIDIRCKPWRDALMVMVQAEPEWAKQFQAALVSTFDAQIERSWSGHVRN